MSGSSLALLMVPREGGGGGTLVFVVQMMLIFAVFYWLLIRPQRKEQERHREMVEALRKGHEVVTAGGIIGTVVHTEEDRITIKTGDNTRLVIERSKVARVLNPDRPTG